MEENDTRAEQKPDSGHPDLREAIRRLPTTSGVYLMKDGLGRVIYVGKAVNLRSRVGSYFNAAAAEDIRTADLVPEIRDIDYIETESEVDALLVEARLIKDVQPKFNQDLKDDKTFPYLEIRIREDFPRVEFTREAAASAARSYTVRSPAQAVCGRRCRCCRRFSSFAPARSTSTRGTRNGGGSALPAGLDRPVHGSLQLADHPKEEYRRDIHRLHRVPGRQQARAAEGDEGRNAPGGRRH